MSLLGAEDPPPFSVVNPAGASPFLLTADHAGRVVPKVLGDLGVSAADMERHIAWDIGIAGVTRKLAAAMDAAAVLQTYSRLVIDCNRKPDVPSAFPVLSEATRIPGNEGLSEPDKRARQAEVFDPYHEQIGRMIAARAGRQTIYLAMHSFTPVYLEMVRGMHVAVLYNRSPAASRLLAGFLRRETGLVVGENEPYRVSDDTDYGVPVHAERGSLDYIELEIRQDLIRDEVGQAQWAARLARLLPIVADNLTDTLVLDRYAGDAR
ncbi:MAG: N-formylglutamate amidohydrolase [Acidocella sp. 20-63-7]|nr:MAG: N-formylglutamate amidohydrolase [Acidocella sp. 20-63-7]HQT46628.1 N-formylglutamate amidohydrolase [Acidocella sp.]